jgi:hypothetical protein
MTYYPESVPPLADDEIVAIVDDLASLHTDFDHKWDEFAAERDAHEAEMLGRIAIAKANTGWSRRLDYGPARVQRTRAEIDLQIPPEYSGVYREAGRIVLLRNLPATEAGAK